MSQHLSAAVAGLPHGRHRDVVVLATAQGAHHAVGLVGSAAVGVARRRCHLDSVGQRADGGVPGDGDRVELAVQHGFHVAHRAGSCKVRRRLTYPTCPLNAS